jgi:hypothetical protein
VNAGDRTRWLDPSPPIAVDGDEPSAPKPRPSVLPEDERPPAVEDAAHDAEDAPTA